MSHNKRFSHIINLQKKSCTTDYLWIFTDSDGNPTVFGRIKIGDVYVCAQAADQFELGIKLDQLVTMVYYGLI